MTALGRARVAVGCGLLALAGLALGASLPKNRARYHLRFASASEVRFVGTSAVLTGHAKAFAESSAAVDLLASDVVGRALAEAERDDGVCYRWLVLPGERPRRELLWMSIAAETSAGASSPPVSDEILRTMRACLRSKDAVLRTATLDRLPLDLRLLEAVSRHAVALAADERPGVEDEKEAILRWLRELGRANQTLVSREQARHGVYPDRAWRAFVFAIGSGGESILQEGYPERPAPKYEWVIAANELVAWVEKNRSKLPEQIR